jgi:hypothetical protein
VKLFHLLPHGNAPALTGAFAKIRFYYRNPPTRTHPADSGIVAQRSENPNDLTGALAPAWSLHPMSPDIVSCFEMKWRMDVSDISFFYGR